MRLLPLLLPVFLILAWFALPRDAEAQVTVSGDPLQRLIHQEVTVYLDKASTASVGRPALKGKALAQDELGLLIQTENKRTWIPLNAILYVDEG